MTGPGTHPGRDDDDHEVGRDGLVEGQTAGTGGPDRRSWRGHLASAAIALGALVGVATLGPTIAEQVGDGLRHDTATARPVPTVLDEDDTGAPAPSTAVTDDVATPADGASTVPPTTVAASSTSVAEAPPVRSIQTVPAVRDVIVAVDGREVATDSSGAIELGPGDADATIEILGIRSDPPLERVEFMAWSDGSTVAARRLDGVAGPTVQVGLRVQRRVVVTAGPASTSSTTLELTSGAGPIEVAVGEPVWVTALRAVPSDTGLVAEELTYVARTVGTETASRPVEPQRFVASPEAIWVVTGSRPADGTG